MKAWVFLRYGVEMPMLFLETLRHVVAVAEEAKARESIDYDFEKEKKKMGGKLFFKKKKEEKEGEEELMR